MNTLFMLGNGFDINCGMNTRYTDVYTGYVKEETNNDVVKKFKNEISGNIENWGDFEIAMAKYAQKLQNETELLECVRDFTVYMKIHIQNEEKKIIKGFLTI